jgi:hypothetical protein
VENPDILNAGPANPNARKIRDYRLLLGALAVLFYVIHGGRYAVLGQMYNMIWACHLGCLLVGIGLLIRRPRVYATGFLWLTLGLPLWITDMATGGTFPTSSLTHAGGFAIAILGLRYLKMPRFSWAVAIAALILLAVFSRLTTPVQENVNLSQAVWAGWEAYFPSHFWYVCAINAGAAIEFYMVEYLARRWTAGKIQGNAPDPR